MLERGRYGIDRTTHFGVLEVGMLHDLMFEFRGSSKGLAKDWLQPNRDAILPVLDEVVVASKGEVGFNAR